jgi:MFS family permease
VLRAGLLFVSERNQRGGRRHVLPAYYGWRIAFTLAFTETISWGILFYAFTVFMTPMEKELGWSRAELTGGFSVALLVMGALAYPVGTWIDKHGSRALMTLGSICAALLVVLWSQVNDVTTFYLIWGGIGACGAAVLYEPAFAVIAVWFVKKRGRALAVITFAAGLASTIFIPLSDWLMHQVGWRDAVMILGIFLAVTTTPLHLLVLRRRPADLGLLPDGEPLPVEGARSAAVGVRPSEALHSRFVWMLTAAFSLAVLSSAAIRVHFIPFLIDVGIDPSTAALASGSIGLMQVAGRVVFAPLEIRFSSRAMVAGVFALQTLSMALFVLPISTALVVVFIAVFGASYGAKTLARATVVADQFGAAHYGRISSIMAIFLTGASTIAPVGAGLIYDRFGTYQPVVWMIVALAGAATVIMVLAKSQADRTPMPVLQPVIMTQEGSLDGR